MSKEERLDILDRNGAVIGQAWKSECHRNPELIHGTSHFALFDKENNRIMFTRRSMKKEHEPGKDTFLGEHVLSGETFEDGAIRGVEEELGFRPKKLKELGENIFEQEKQTEYVKFFVVYYNGEEIAFDDNEMDSVWWIDIEDIKDYNDNVSEMTKYWIDNVDWSKI